jgi:hypothetical protein
MGPKWIAIKGLHRFLKNSTFWFWLCQVRINPEGAKGLSVLMGI